MAKVGKIEFHEDAWAGVLSDIVDAWAVPVAERIADAANAHVLAQAEATLAQDSSVAPAGNTKADMVVAAARERRRRANKKIAHIDPPEGKRDYLVSVEGSNPLNLNDYRATVITVTDRAKIDNARNNTLIRLLGSGG